MRRGEPGRARDDGSGGLDTEEIGSALEKSRQEEGGNLRDGDGLLSGFGLPDGGSGSSRRRNRSWSGRGRTRGRRSDQDVDGVCGSLRVGDQRSGKDGGVIHFIVGVAEQVSETDDGVLAILDELGLGAVADVLRMIQV